MAGDTRVIDNRRRVGVGWCHSQLLVRDTPGASCVRADYVRERATNSLLVPLSLIADSPLGTDALL